MKREFQNRDDIIRWIKKEGLAEKKPKPYFPRRIRFRMRLRLLMLRAKQLLCNHKVDVAILSGVGYNEHLLLFKATDIAAVLSYCSKCKKRFKIVDCKTKNLTFYELD